MEEAINSCSTFSKNLGKKGYIVKVNSFRDDIDIFIADYCWFPPIFIRKLKLHKFRHKSKLIHDLMEF